MKKIFFLLLPFAWANVFSQPVKYTVANSHSHNDYEKPFPFREAYNQGFGSIEADIYLRNNNLIVAHDTVQVKWGRTLDSLYLQPLQQCIEKNKGFVYADNTRQLQLMIDIKTAAVPTLKRLIEKLQLYPLLINCQSLKIVISGNRPPVAEFNSYPPYIYFDGELHVDYPAPALDKIEMLSDNFRSFSHWNGNGLIPQLEKNTLDSLIRKAHRLHKTVRFWNAPDGLNSWYAFMRLGVDYINTDYITGMGTFLKQLPGQSYTATSSYKTYAPQYKNDGSNKTVKNIILLIGDGTGLAQWYSAYTANKGALNVFNMRFTGLSKTSSYEGYITDAASGSTAFSSGEKTNSRSVGVDKTGRAMVLLPDILAKRSMKTGIVSSGDITGAAPAGFYAHQPEGSNNPGVLNDLLNAPIDLLMGKASPETNAEISAKLAQKFTVVSSADSVQPAIDTKWLVLDKRAGLSMLEGRGDWAEKAFAKSIDVLSQNKQGFFLVLEGAQADHGGHANNLPTIVTEVMDFDQVIGPAMQFADSNGETLVIVTGGQETGGLTLTDGNYSKGYVAGQFSTDDHTATPVPVFAYGPRAGLFTGVYENTAIFDKILEALGIKK